MKNTAINTLKYTGIVTLSQYIGTKKIKIAQTHNTGGNPLFSFLADCLVGDFTKARATRPTKIMLLNYETDADGNIINFTRPPEAGFIDLLTRPENKSDTTQCRVRYSFIIPKDQLGVNFTNLGIGLYHAGAKNNDNDISDFAAFCKLEALTKNILINASLVVDWELIIANNATDLQIN